MAAVANLFGITAYFASICVSWYTLNKMSNRDQKQCGEEDREPMKEWEG